MSCELAATSARPSPRNPSAKSWSGREGHAAALAPSWSSAMTPSLLGIFTDSDLARLFENRREVLLDAPISQVMTADPIRVQVGEPVTEAVETLRSRKLSELPVVDRGGRLVGLIDITDLIGLPADDIED